MDGVNYLEVTMPSRSLCTMTALAIALVIAVSGCSSGGRSPIFPDLSGTDMGIGQAGGGGITQESNRQIWGLWTMEVSEDHTRITANPDRSGAFHLNATGYLENPTQLLTISNVKQTEDDTITADIQLVHPFQNKPNLTGFDVRGIAIFQATKLFPSTVVYDAEEQLASIYASRVLVGADGYTTDWNRSMYQQVYHPQIFGYIKGKLATWDEYTITGNLHGFMQFSTEPTRHIFRSNQSATRTYEFDFPPGPLKFGYAVDACWEPPTENPVTNPITQFPPSANCLEPYEISVSILANTLTKIAGMAIVQFDVFDWQDPTNFSSVHVESPDLFYGTIDPGAPVGFPGPNTARYEVAIPNSKGSALTAQGGSDLLIAVEDSRNSVVSNEIWNTDLTAYQIVKLPVADVAGFWRDRNGDGSYINYPLVAPLMEPSTLSNGSPDISVVSRPVLGYSFFDGDPEIMVFDDNDSRFDLYNRALTVSWPKAGYPFQAPPSWLLYPHAMDATDDGWFAVASTNEQLVSGGPYAVKNLANVFNQGGVYGFSWHTGTDDGTANAYLELCRDITAGFGPLADNPLYALFTYESGTEPNRANILSIGKPYTNPSGSNTFRTFVPMENAGWAPNAIYGNAPVLKCGIDTDPVGLPSLKYAFYVVESDPGIAYSEIESFSINIQNIDPVSLWSLPNAEIQAEFPGAWALDCEVVPSHMNNITTLGTATAAYNWLCVLMRDNTHYWLAFYDPLNPSPNNPGHNIYRTIYKSNKIPLDVTSPAPVAMDVDNQYFEVYVLCEDPSSAFFASVFEFFYLVD
jgi:hypothetical protein